MTRDERNMYMRVWYKNKMLTDKAYAERYKAQAKIRKAKHRKNGGDKRYQETHKATIQINKGKYYKENWQRFKDYRSNRKPARNEARRKSYHQQPIMKLKNNIRSLITTGIKKAGYTKRSKLTAILGCTFEVFSKYFEGQFTPEMNWQNIHCDHIIPICLAATESEVLALSNYKNFRPCFIVDNIKKGCKIDIELIERHGLLWLYNSLTRT